MENYFKPIWKKETLEDAKLLLSSTTNFLRHIGVDSCIIYGTLLGHKRHSGNPIPWDDDLDMLVDGDALSKDDNLDCFRKLLNIIGIDMVPFYGGYKIFFAKYDKKLNIEGYRHSWPFIDLFLYRSMTSRYMDSRTPGIIVQGRPPWSSKNLKQQWWYPKSIIFPLQSTKFLSQTVYVPNNVDAVLDRDYGEDHLTVGVPPSWDHQRDCYTDHPKDKVDINKIKELYQKNGWQW